MKNESKRFYQHEENRPEQLLWPYEVATILGIGRSTVHQLVKEGRLGCIQITKRNRRFTMELVEEFIKSATVLGDTSEDVDFLKAPRIVRA